MEAGITLLGRRIAPDSNVSFVLNEMSRSSARMSRLISDVLDFARGRLGGGLSIARRPSTELSGLLRQVVGEVQAAHPARVVQTDIAPDLDVQCDPDRIAQLMSNLLANAVSHGDPAQPIRVSAATAGGIFEMAVANGGKPIPEDVRARLFQPFYRGDKTSVREGLGLGLYISNQIALAHGGQLTVRSGEAETRFAYRMPTRAR
jgi:signal transduction histidine kinase